MDGIVLIWYNLRDEIAKIHQVMQAGIVCRLSPPLFAMRLITKQTGAEGKPNNTSLGSWLPNSG